MKLATAMLLLLTPALAGFSAADDFVCGSIQSGEVIGQVFEGRPDFIEGWNVDVPFDGSWSYAAPCQGPTYVAGVTYYLERVEFMAGEIAGPATIEIRAHDGSGCPSGELLASGSFDQVVELGWQGADLDVPVYVEAGMTYHINYVVVVDSPSSFAVSGDIYPHCWSWDCVTWEGPSTSFYWMAKFFGTEDPSAEETTTWGLIKALYQ
jgi:hypothetical protein